MSIYEAVDCNVFLGECERNSGKKYSSIKIKILITVKSSTDKHHCTCCAFHPLISSQAS
jgi:hypothetical protein